jgi:hypothetical protein
MSTQSLLVFDECMDESTGEYDLANIMPFGKKEDVQTDSDDERPRFTISPAQTTSPTALPTHQPNIDFISHVLCKYLPNWSPDLTTWKSFYADIFDDSLSAEQAAGNSKFAIETLIEVLRKLEPELSAQFPASN